MGVLADFKELLASVGTEARLSQPGSSSWQAYCGREQADRKQVASGTDFCHECQEASSTRVKKDVARRPEEVEPSPICSYHIIGYKARGGKIF